MYPSQKDDITRIDRYPLTHNQTPLIIIDEYPLARIEHPLVQGWTLLNYSNAGSLLGIKRKKLLKSNIITIKTSSVDNHGLTSTLTLKVRPMDPSPINMYIIKSEIPEVIHIIHSYFLLTFNIFRDMTNLSVDVSFHISTFVTLKKEFT